MPNRLSEMWAEKCPLDLPIWKSPVTLTGAGSVSVVSTEIYLFEEQCVRSENGYDDYQKLF